jgi:hypothetical protein
MERIFLAEQLVGLVRIKARACGKGNAGRVGKKTPKKAATVHKHLS